MIKHFLILLPSLAALVWSVCHLMQEGTPDVGVFFLLCLSLVHTLLLMMLTPEKGGGRVKIASYLCLAFTAGAYFVEDPWAFAALWILSAVPAMLLFPEKTGRAQITFFVHHLLASFCLCMGFILIAPPAHSTQIPGLFLLCLAAFIRQGIFPFHLWFKASYRSRPYPLNISFYMGNLGLFLFMKVILPLVQEHATLALIWGMISGFYFANLSFAQRSIRSSVFYVMLAQFSLLFCGLESGTIHGITGVLFQFLTFSLSFSGLIACLYVLEWNLGELRTGKFHGLQEHNPFLAVCFLLFSLASVALPFSMGFVGEDLIFHAIIERHPFIGMGVIVSAALSGLSLFRVYCFLFRGPRNRVLDDHLSLAFWQKLALAVLIVILFGFGIWPDPLLRHVQKSSGPIHSQSVSKTSR
jgi:NADH-quinone oxidoreductase subunit M